MINQTNRLKKIHRAALEAFDLAYTASEPERRLCAEDRRFVSVTGASWEGALGQAFENRPMLEVNPIIVARRKIFGEWRNNQYSVNFESRDGETDEKLADFCSGLLAADEADSNADEAFSQAFGEGIDGGFGAFRWVTEYADEYKQDDDMQRLRLEPIYEADTCVFFDSDAKRYDKSDSTWCWVLVFMSNAAYEEKYSDTPAAWPATLTYNYDWSTVDGVYVAEVYKVETKPAPQRAFVNLVDGEKIEGYATDFTDDDVEEMLASGWRELETEEVRSRRRVQKYIMSGGGVLEDCGYIAGDRIPVIPFYGQRFFVNNTERMMGEARWAKDMVRLGNLQMSALAELSAKAGTGKPIVTPAQMAGHESLWSEDPVKNNPYLLLNPTLDAQGNEVPAGPIGYFNAPDIPPAIGALLQLTNTAVKEALGGREEGQKMVSNISAKAIELVQQQIDTHAYVYISNWAQTLKNSARVWLGMGRDIYTKANRSVKLADKEKGSKFVRLMQPIIDPETQKQVTANDMRYANFDVLITTGPTSTSAKNASVTALTSMMAITTDEELKQVLGLMAMQNMSAYGIDDAKKYARKKLVAMGVTEPNDEEKEQMANAAQSQKPDPNAVLAESMAEESSAKAALARANVIKALSDAEKSEAQTMQIKVDTALSGQGNRTA